MQIKGKEYYMTIDYWCLLVMIVFPYVFTVLAKTGPGFNNQTPREYLDKVQGWRKRAYWVQLNSFEAFPGFAASIFVVHQMHADQIMVNRLAITFIVARILHAICYMANKSSLRTLFWSIGLGCVIAIFIVAATAGPTGFT